MGSRFGSPAVLARLCADGSSLESVELKALLSTAAGPAAEALTGRASPTWSERRTYLIDTEALELLRAGVEIRLRRRARGRYDLSVSAQRRGTTCDPNTPRGVRVELDVVPGAVWRDLEARCDVDAGDAAYVIGSGLDPGELLSPTQRFWALRGGRDLVDDARLKELTVLGPLVVNRVKVSATQVGLRRADLEHFRYPSGLAFVELSTHCDPREVSSTAAAFERLLDDPHISAAPDYHSRSSLWQKELQIDLATHPGAGPAGRPCRPVRFVDTSRTG